MPSPEDLVFAIGHEVGNLLAAVRLQAQLSDADSNVQIAELAGRSGALLALVRPVLTPAPASRLLPLAVRDVLESVRRGLDDPSDPRVVFDLEATRSLPDVAVEGDLLQQLLLADLLAAFEELAPGGRVLVSAEAAGSRVVFRISAPGPASGPAPAPRLSGRGLCVALGRHLLGRRGGGASESGGTDARCAAFEVAAAR